jgi:hypothetical protein
VDGFGSRGVGRRQSEVFIATVKRSVEALDRWVLRNGWTGYDPYDAKGIRLFMWALALKKSGPWSRLFRRLILGPLIVGETLCPRLFRKAFRVRPAINAKGMSLFAKAYLQLYEATGIQEYLERARACLKWLDQNKAAGYGVACWGYPFEWQSGVVVPAGTPASVVTAAGCDAYWTAWKMLKDRAYLKVCGQCCEFFLKHLNVDEIDSDTICFSYTPIDNFHVHNTNLLVAELLIRVGTELGNDEWVRMGLRAGNYALREQNEDGSLFYWGRVQNHMNPNRVDHYHTGFEIRCLYGIWKVTGREEYRRAAERYYAFYRTRLIEHGGDWAAPRMYPHSRYPVNIHSCAEAVLLSATLAAEYPEARLLLERLVRWVIENMQVRDGHFIYMRRKMCGIEWRSTIPYIRWGQAWMLLALSQVSLIEVEAGR